MQYPTRKSERNLNRKGYRYVAGVDEAGRGAWAGPIVAAAVVLPRNCRIRGINDSKKLSPVVRENLYEQIIKDAVAYTVSFVTHGVIDARGIQYANINALRRSANRLSVQPDYILVDSFKVTWKNIPSTSIIHGDGIVTAIAAASIVAKVTRDRMMTRYALRYPHYRFETNMGYGTKAHQRGLDRYGICDIHRRSYKPIKLYS